MLRKYESDTSHVLDWHDLNLQENVMYKEKEKYILDTKERVLQNKTIPLVKVLWDHHGVEEATWELESNMRKKYPEVFTCFLFLNFADEIFLRGRECNTQY